MRPLTVKWICLFMVAYPSLVEAGMPNPSQYRSAIQKRGALSVLQSLVSDEPRFADFVHHVGQGENDYLDLAVTFRKLSDAGVAARLDLALGEALEHAPDLVLKKDPDGNQIKLICGGPDVDDARYGSLDLALAAIARRMDQVSDIKDKALRSSRKICIASLKQSRKGVKHFYSASKKAG